MTRNLEEANPINKAVTPHDEAFKKLLQTFFSEFIELFFPDLAAKLDHSNTRFLMQELLVDVVGMETRTMDMLLETRYIGSDAYILIMLEPQSYRQNKFAQRFFIYFSRLHELHCEAYKVIIPIVIFTADDPYDEPDEYTMGLPEMEILKFRFLKVQLRQQNWRQFFDSTNPVAAALLAIMGYSQREKKELRMAYLRLILQLQNKQDPARLELIMSIAGLYPEPDPEQDEEILKQFAQKNLEGAEKRWS